MVDVQTVSIAVASASVVLAAIYYIFQVRHQTKVRQTDLIIRLYSTIVTREFVENDVSIFNQEVNDLEGFMRKYSSFPKFMESPEYVPYMMDSEFFEGVGILLRRKLVDIELVDDLFSSPIITIWEKTLPMTKALREYFKRPQLAEWFEYHYDEMNKREQKLEQKGVKNG
jgi:hypothetical protein